jgi:hypothetical protein
LLVVLITILIEGSSGARTRSLILSNQVKPIKHADLEAAIAILTRRFGLLQERRPQFNVWCRLLIDSHRKTRLG